MKKDKDRQVGVRVGLPVFFALELEDAYRYMEGAHRALAFPDFCGLLIGLGLEAYRKGTGTIRPETEQEKSPGRGSLGLARKRMGRKKSMNNDFTIAMDTARELMDGGIPFLEAVCQGLDESSTIDRWKREKTERRAGKAQTPETRRPVPYPASRREENGMTASVPEFRGCFKSGDSTPRIRNRSDALQLIEEIGTELNHTRPKSYYLQAGLKALKDAIGREII
jgi:hypothetical protein